MQLQKQRNNFFYQESLVRISADPELFSSNIQDKSSEFWLLYLDMMRNQHMTHLAVQEKNLGLRLAAWKKLLPLYFPTNQFSYAKYGSYYVKVLANIVIRMVFLQKTGLSVQTQKIHLSRVAVDQRGEQTVNRYAKTVGKVPEI